MKFGCQEIQKIIQADCSGDWTAHGVSIDTRSIVPGNLFVALTGDNTDGHAYVADALAKGAVGAVVSQPIEDVPLELQCIVPDTLAALTALGKYARTQLTGKIIGITGSAGKTTTKEGLAQVLANYGNVFASAKNFNNHLGVPLNLCNAPTGQDYYVFEMGMNHAGELTELTQLVQPDIALITNIHPMHIENFENLAGIAYAKSEIYAGLSEAGTAIYNANANHVEILAEQASASAAKSAHSFGKAGDSIKLVEVNAQPAGDKVTIAHAGQQLAYLLGQSGEHHVYNSLAILTVLKALNLDLAPALSALRRLSPLAGRGQQHVLHLPTSGTYTLIDESYSGQPEAMRLAIENLTQLTPANSGRRLAVIGQMAELGEHNAAAHRQLGQQLAAANIDFIIGVGESMQIALAELPAEQNAEYYPNISGLSEKLLNEILQPNDILLIKGSRYSSRVFEVVDTLLTRH